MKKTVFGGLISVMMLAAACSLVAPASKGILKTANGGVDWQGSNKIKGNDKADLSNLSVSKLEYGPPGSNTIFAGSTNAGMYKSTDGGAAWEEILGTVPVMDFVIDPGNADIIYAAGTVDDKARVLGTRDGGKSWTEVYSEGSKSEARAIAVNPANSQQVVVGLSKGNLIASDNSGQSWRLLQNYNDRVNQVIWRSEGLYVVVRNKGIFKSTDNGGTFQQINSTIKQAARPEGSSYFGSPSTYTYLAVAYGNPQELYAATNVGLYKSENGGSSWSFVNMPFRQKDALPVSIAISRSSENVIYVGAGSNIYKTSDSGFTWLTSDTGTGNIISTLLVDPELPQVAYAGVTPKQRAF